MSDSQVQGSPDFVVDGDQLVDESGDLQGQRVEQPEDFWDQDPLELAHAAGQAMATEPPDRSHPDSCPFPLGDPQHDAWMNGFKSVLEQQLQADPATLIKVIDDRIEANDSSVGTK